MEFMLDTLNLEAISKWSKILPLAGVTSNPTIAKQEGRIDFFERIGEVRRIIGEQPSLHIQVIAKDYEGILDDAREIRERCGDVYIKVPVTEAGLAAIKTLKDEGYKVTATAIYSTMQGLLAIAAGADYLAPYYNRMENLNIDPQAVIEQLVETIEREGSSSKVLAASFKNVGQVNRALKLGAHAVTVSPDIFEATFAMPSIQKAVDDFAKDWQDSQARKRISY